MRCHDKVVLSHINQETNTFLIFILLISFASKTKRDHTVSMYVTKRRAALRYACLSEHAFPTSASGTLVCFWFVIGYWEVNMGLIWKFNCSGTLEELTQEENSVIHTSLNVQFDCVKQSSRTPLR